MDKIEELEGLRGLLAVWVVVVHLLPAAGIEASSTGYFSPLFGELIRVQVFCILSGFVLFIMLSKSQETYFAFLVRRLARIYPVYILAFAASVALSGIAYDALVNASFVGGRNAARLHHLEDAFANWPLHILSHVTLLHGVIPVQLLPSAPYTFLGQAWNISTEFQFYIVVPFLFWVLSRSSGRARLIMLAAIVVGWLALRRWPNSAALPHYAVYFGVGILSFYVWKRDWSRASFLNKGSLAIGTIILFAIDPASSMWFLIFVSALIARDRSSRRGALSVFLTHPIMLTLGALSYSLYLLHMIPLFFWMSVLNRLDLGQISYLVCLSVLTFACALPMSYVVHHMVEKKFYRSKTHKTSLAKMLRLRSA